MKVMRLVPPTLVALSLMTATAADHAESSPGKSSLEFVQVSEDGRHFVLSDSRAEFTPWGFNFDHDDGNRLLETYWRDEWDSIVGDFAEMKQLGANTVRIHLQVSRFMKSASKPNEDSLSQLARLLALAEQNGLYLDVTGLGCYDKKDTPDWYDQMNEAQRWAVQARFWEAIAKTCQSSPAVFCYDLMNEPVVTEDKTGRDWTPGSLGDFHFVQRLTLDFGGRTPKQIAAAWVNQLVAAIRKHDARHLITVGAIPWALTWPTAKPLFYSPEVSRNLDFVSLHFYPSKDEVARALTALAVYDIGKPMVIEEMFPLSCPVKDLDAFIDGSKPLVSGWIGFYWGKSIAEYKKRNKGPSDAITREWLEYFVRKTPSMVKHSVPPKAGVKEN